MKLLLTISIVMLFVCVGRHNVKKIQAAVSESKDTIPEFMSITSHVIDGDFDGNGIRETLVSFVSDSTGRKIDSIPAGKDWGNTIDNVFRKGISTKIFIKGQIADTLQFGSSMGIYCLINLGDINNDKKDEIALVVDWADYSNLNTARIYTLCSGKWLEMKTFGINEGMAFDWEGETMPSFKIIPGALEKHSGKWMYLDFYEWMEMESPKMRPLKVGSCK